MSAPQTRVVSVIAEIEVREDYRDPLPGDRVVWRRQENPGTSGGSGVVVHIIEGGRMTSEPQTRVNTERGPIPASKVAGNPREALASSPSPETRVRQIALTGKVYCERCGHLIPGEPWNGLRYLRIRDLCQDCRSGFLQWWNHNG